MSDERIREAVHALLEELTGDPVDCEGGRHVPTCDIVYRSKHALIASERAAAAREALEGRREPPAANAHPSTRRKGLKLHRFGEQSAGEGPSGYPILRCIKCPVDTSYCTKTGRHWYRVDDGEWMQTGFVGCEPRARAAETKETP